MNWKNCGSVCVFAFILALILTADAWAALITSSGTSSDGHSVSGSADFALSAANVTVTLTNSTSTTLDAGELFTGIDFSLGGLTPSLTSTTGIERSVADNGTYSDT